jgi:hypothetical protein
MPHRDPPQSSTARTNSRGCFALAIVIVLLIAALAYIGFRADPINELNAVIPSVS